MYKSKLYQILGLIIISWLLYRTLLVNRLPYTINDKVPLLTLILVIIIILTHLVVLYFIIKRLFNGGPLKINTFLLTIVNHLYYKPLNTIQDNLLHYKIINKTIRNFAVILELSIRTKYNVYFSCVYLLCLPRLLLALYLLGDVLILNKIHTFYTLFWVILIPLIFKSILSIVKQQITDEQHQLTRDYLTVSYIKDIPQVSEKTKQTTPEFATNVKLWTFYENILDIIKAIALYQEKRSYLIISLIPTSLFLCGWFSYIYLVLSCKYSLLPPPDFLLWLIRILYLPF